MNPVLTIVSILLLGVSAAHLLRLIFQIDIIIGGFIVPMWVSIVGFIIPLALALLLWRENRKEFVKTHLSPLEIAGGKTTNKTSKKVKPTMTILK